MLCVTLDRCCFPFYFLSLQFSLAARLSEGLQQARTEESQLRYDPEGEDRDCADFDTHREAQAFFEAAGWSFGRETKAFLLWTEFGVGATVN